MLSSHRPGPRTACPGKEGMCAGGRTGKQEVTRPAIKVEFLYGGQALLGHERLHPIRSDLENVEPHAACLSSGFEVDEGGVRRMGGHVSCASAGRA